MTTTVTNIVAGRAPQPFALVDVGNPTWWRCPKCTSSDIPRALWKNCGLYGFRCYGCNHVWHYTATTIVRKRAE